MTVWKITAALGLLVLALPAPGTGQARTAGAPSDRPDAQMLLDLDLLRDPELAKNRDLYRRMGVVERMRMLEMLQALESDSQPAPNQPVSNPPGPRRPDTGGK